MPKPEKDAAVSTSLLHDFNSSEKTSTMFTKRVIILFITVAVLGVGTGFVLSKNSGAVPGVLKNESKGDAPKGKVTGSDDLDYYKDVAEGKLKKGGIEGEGQYHLERPGGESQNVYLTSATVDLSEFLGNKIKVWGQTQKAQKAGWLMDVGCVEVLE